MLEVRRLRLLRELAHRGTIAATAEACSLTPSAVSQQLAALEHDVRTPLFIRKGRRLILTEAARILVTHTERVLAELEQASANVSGLTSVVRGTVRLAAFPTAASALVPAAIAECRAHHPDLHVILEEREASAAVAELRAGHLDLAMVYEYNLLPAMAEPGIELVPLVRESLLAALPPQSDPPGDHGVLAALRDEPWIAPHSDHALRDTMVRACGLAGFQPRVDYTSDDYTVLLAVVRAGLGVTLVPQLALESITADVHLMPVDQPTLTRTVSAAVRAGSRNRPQLAALLEALVRSATALDLTPPGPQYTDT